MPDEARVRFIPDHFFGFAFFTADSLAPFLTLLFPRALAALVRDRPRKTLCANHRAFFILLALYGPVDVVDTLLKRVGACSGSTLPGMPTADAPIGMGT